MSVVLQKKLPPNWKDPGVFSIPCKIKNICLDRPMLNFGASINVIPRSIYDKLNLGKLKKTSLIISLANKSNAHPDGVLKNVLVQVNELVFSTDFYVLDMVMHVMAFYYCLVDHFLKHLGQHWLKNLMVELLSSIFLMPWDFLLMITIFVHFVWSMNYPQMFINYLIKWIANSACSRFGFLSAPYHVYNDVLNHIQSLLRLDVIGIPRKLEWPKSHKTCFLVAVHPLN